MIPVFQTKFGPRNGNCMQAVVASLLELPLSEVPEFRGTESQDAWFDKYCDCLRSHGYEYDQILSNPRQLGGYGANMFEEIKDGKHSGIKGDFFYASVYSPGLFDRVQYICNPLYRGPLHAVVIDRDFNIIHDPHPHYQGVKQYPLHERIEYNGVIGVDIFKPIIK